MPFCGGGELGFVGVPWAGEVVTAGLCESDGNRAPRSVRLALSVLSSGLLGDGDARLQSTLYRLQLKQEG